MEISSVCCKWCQSIKQDGQRFCPTCGHDSSRKRNPFAPPVFSAKAYLTAEEAVANGTTCYLEKACAIAERVHRAQVRKGTLPLPYISHVYRVAALVGYFTDLDPETTCAALVHDCLEAVGVAERARLLDEVADTLGYRVAALTHALTDLPHLCREQKKQYQLLVAPAQNRQWKVIKIADKIANLEDIRFTPPSDWSRDRTLYYRDHAVMLISLLGEEGDIWLDKAREAFDFELKQFDRSHGCDVEARPREEQGEL